MATDQKTALIVVMSPITRDPRVRRQIAWLTQAGWTVDTVGPSGHHVDLVRDHFGLAAQSRWVSTKFGSALIYGLLPMRFKFRRLVQSLIPHEATVRIRRGDYALVLFNDHHFLPWIADRKTFTPAALREHIHLDIHEYVTPRVERDSLWRRFAGPYYDWIRTFIGDPRFTTRSTVVRGIAELYADEFSIPLPAIIRNCPPYIEQKPSAVDPGNIKLLHHGGANWLRGIHEMIDAMRLVNSRFSLTLMLVGEPESIEPFRRYAQGMEDRVHFVPPVRMHEIAQEVNKYDIEVMFFPPRNQSLKLALPNKLFEAIQGRLGAVIGESPMMAEVVTRYENGKIVSGWSAEDLASTLNSLHADQVADYKRGSDNAAQFLSAEHEQSVFMSIINEPQLHTATATAATDQP